MTLNARESLDLLGKYREFGSGIFVYDTPGALPGWITKALADGLIATSEREIEGGYDVCTFRFTRKGRRVGDDIARNETMVEYEAQREAA